MGNLGGSDIEGQALTDHWDKDALGVGYDYLHRNPF